MLLPMTEQGEWTHRQQKRKWEGSLVVKAIEGCLQGDSYGRRDSLRVLEFGCGDAFQIPYMQQIGDVVASDVRLSQRIQDMKSISFVLSSAEGMPFCSGQFDVIFSNHVIEHINNLDAAFVEVRRIGAEQCLFAFSVPTSYWLLLSVPARYCTKVRLVLNRLRYRGGGAGTAGRQRGLVRRLKSFLRFLHPGGHGMGNFFQCFWAFRIRQWERLFCAGAFRSFEAIHCCCTAPQSGHWCRPRGRCVTLMSVRVSCS